MIQKFRCWIHIPQRPGIKTLKQVRVHVFQYTEPDVHITLFTMTKTREMVMKTEQDLNFVLSNILLDCLSFLICNKLALKYILCSRISQKMQWKC